MNLHPPIRLLIVEDNPGDYEILKEYLLLTNLRVEENHWCENLASAREVLQQNKIDIAFLDLSLPDSFGIESFTALREQLPNTPIIILSGLSDTDIALKAISMGAQDYLLKGEFNEKLLAKSIQYSIERNKTQQKLLESYQRYEYVNKATNDIIWEWDLQTNEVIRSQSLSKVFGYPIQVIKNSRDWWDDHIHPEDRKKVAKNIRHFIEKRYENWQDEYRIRAADGSYRYVLDKGYSLFDKEGKPFRMIGAISDISETKNLQNELAMQQIAIQKQLTEATILVQEQEREEIGKELHDNINQILATVKMFLNMAKENEKMREDLVDRSFNNVNLAIEEIRKLSKALVAPSLGDIGLVEALEEMLEEINVSNSMDLQFINMTTPGLKISPNLELMLYRIVQEQLNNIIKYAKAKSVIITLKTDAETVFLSICDDGVGFEPEKKGKGIGLRNIRNRVEFYNGIMNINSAPTKGCILEISIPI